MQQATLDFVPPTADPGDPIAFRLGWDHARHGLVPPDDLHEGAVGQGWRAAKAVLGRRAPAGGRALRQWLALRIEAWREGIAFDSEALGASVLARLAVARCPVNRQPLVGIAGHPDELRFVRLDPTRGFVPGNVVALSRRAAEVQQKLAAAEALQRMRRADAGIETPPAGLTIDEFGRLAVLLSFGAVLDFADAARTPLLVAPPPGVRPVTALQRLQLAATALFAAPGWSARARAWADALPTARHEFLLFVGAMAPRLLQGAGSELPLVDAWTDARLQRRWAQFAQALGESGCAALLAPQPGTASRARVAA